MDLLPGLMYARRLLWMVACIVTLVEATPIIFVNAPWVIYHLSMLGSVPTDSAKVIQLCTV